MARVVRRNVVRRRVACPPAPVFREPAGKIARYTSMMPCTWWM